VRAALIAIGAAAAVALALVGCGLLLALGLVAVTPGVPAPGDRAPSEIPTAALLAGDPFAHACRPVVTQPYGPTANPLEPVIGGRHFHTGIDLACPEGTPVHSLTDGVAHVTLGWGGGYGDNVVVEVETRLPGDLVTQRYFVRYAHLEMVAVMDDAVVHGGDIVGLEGSTGNSTGPHLHLEVDRGEAAATSSINPLPLLEVG
jgi:murein DD-endopeptidase MepM/ murein hydrolase activator NlpD